MRQYASVARRGGMPAEGRTVSSCHEPFSRSFLSMRTPLAESRPLATQDARSCGPGCLCRSRMSPFAVAAVWLLLLAHPSSGTGAGGSFVDELPSNGPELTQLGGLLLSQGDIAGAQRAFEKATRLFPSVSLTWYNLAISKNQAGQLEQAQSAYRRASELSPEDPDLLKSLAGVQARQGQLQDSWQVIFGTCADSFYCCRPGARLLACPFVLSGPPTSTPCPCHSRP